MSGCRNVDHWLWGVTGVVMASFTGLILSDALPPALEVPVNTALLCSFGLYGAMMLVSLVWGAGVMFVRLRHARPLHRRLAVLCAGCGALAFFSALTARLGFAGSLSAAALQLLTPPLVVFGLRPRSPWCAMALGAGAALVSIVVHVASYAVVFGVEGGHLIGDIGPGVSNLSDLVPFFCLLRRIRE